MLRTTNNFNFHYYQSHVTPILYDTKIQIHKFSQNLPFLPYEIACAFIYNYITYAKLKVSQNVKFKTVPI